MRTFLFAAVCIAFAAVFVAWALIERKRTSPRLWLAFLGSALALPIAFYAGMFVSSFDDNLCYSGVITEILSLPAKPQAKLPLEGYETSCRSVARALESNGKVAE